MKRLLTVFVVLSLTRLVSAQTATTSTEYYAQSLVYLASPSEYTTFADQLRSNPYVKMVRVDQHSHQLFLVTQGVSSFDAATLHSWAGSYDSGISCIHTGILGITQPKNYINGECPSEN